MQSYQFGFVGLLRWMKVNAGHGLKNGITLNPILLVSTISIPPQAHFFFHHSLPALLVSQDITPKYSCNLNWCHLLSIHTLSIIKYKNCKNFYSIKDTYRLLRLSQADFPSAIIKSCWSIAEIRYWMVMTFFWIDDKQILNF